MAFFQTAGNDFEFKMFFVSALAQLDGNFRWLDPPARGGLQSQRAAGNAGQVGTHSDFHAALGTIRDRNNLLARLQFDRKCGRDGQRAPLLNAFLVGKRYQHRGRNFRQGLGGHGGAIVNSRAERWHIVAGATRNGAGGKGSV